MLSLVGCVARLERERAVQTTADREDFRAKTPPVLIAPVGDAPQAPNDPDDLLKYVNVSLHPYLNSVRRVSDGSYLMIFKGKGESIQVPDFRDLMDVELVKVERFAIQVRVRGRATLRVALHEGRSQRGGVVRHGDKKRR